MGLPHATPASITRLVAWLVLVFVAFLQVYLLLLEGGHALAALAAGGTVRTVDARPWSTRPHASYDLPGVTDGQRALVSAAGTLLPLAAWAASITALPRALPPALALVRFFVSVGVLAGLLPWIVLPWPPLHGDAPRDDIVRFTQSSGRPPAVIAGLAVAAMAGGFALLWWRVGGGDHLRAFRRMRSVDVPAATLAGTGGCVVASVALGLALFAAFPPREAGPVGGGVVIPTHDPIAAVTLDGAPFAGTTMGVASSRPRLELPPGPWTLTLTAAEGTVGRMRVWNVVDE